MCDLTCRTGRDRRTTGVGQCGSEARSPSIHNREAGRSIWRYSWNGADLVTVRMGQSFQFKRNDDAFTSRNVMALVDYFRGLVQNEREQHVRGNRALGWLANLWSGEPPNRSRHFRQMDLAVSQAEAAAARRDLSGVITAIQGGLESLNTARHLYAAYLERHIESAEANAEAVKITRDVSLAVSTTVLTGGSGLGVQAAVAGGVAASTTIVEEVGVAGWDGRYADVDWGRIALDSTAAIVASLLGPLADDFGKAVAGRLGAFVRRSNRLTEFSAWLARRYPTLGSGVRDRILADLGSGLRSGGSGPVLAELGVDGRTLQALITTVAVDTVRSAPANLFKLAVESALRETAAAAGNGQHMSQKKFLEKLMDSLLDSPISRTFVTGLLAAMST